MQTNDVLFNAFWITVYIVILVGFFAWVIYAFINWRKKRYLKDHQYELTFLQVKVPQQDETEVEAAQQMFSNMTGFRRSFTSALVKGQPTISFEIVSKAEGIGFFVVVPDDLVTFVEKQINGAYPDAEIDIIDPNEIWDRGAVTEIVELKLAGKPFFPITTYKELEGSDTLSAITSSLSKVKPDEVLAIQYVVSPASNSWRSAGSSFVAHIQSKANNPEKPMAIDTSIVEGVEDKVSKPGFDVSIRLVCISDDRVSAQTHIRNIATSFDQFTNVKYNRFKRTRPLRKKKLIDDFIYRRMRAINIQVPIFNVSLYKNVSVLNTAELATVFHFPNVKIKTPNIQWLESRRAPAPSNVPKEGLYLGDNIFRNIVTPIHMREEDRQRHNYIIGQTGSGKSVYMSSLAIQDIYNGEGVAYIDPHGSEIDKLLLEIPDHRLDDVILWDVSDVQRPMGLNLMEAESEEEKNMVINAFIALLYKLYDPNRQGIMGPQLERAIRNVMLTAMVDPDSTMVDVLRLLIDADYVNKFLPKVEDPLVKKFWTDEMAKTSDFHKSEKMGYFVSKFDRFVTERLMRNILGQPKSAFNIKKVMAEKKILLVDLSKGKIGEENSNFLGLLLVPKILGAALARADLIGKEEFPNFYLYVDEFQNFATPDFATILSEARKYKLNLTVAHQFVAQLTDEIKDAIFGNVGTMNVFRVGVDDAAHFENQFEPTFTDNDLINLPVGNCYLRLLIDGHPSAPFSMHVDWEKVNRWEKRKDVAEQIRQASRQKYGRDVKEVEAYINDRAGFNDKPPEPEKPDRKKLIPF